MSPAPIRIARSNWCRSFVDQALIAIENVRLFNETKEALERQTATAEILKVIASSPSEVQPVFDAIVTSSVRLSDGFSAGVYRFVDEKVHLGAFTSMNPVADETLRASFPRPIADLEHFRSAQQTGEVFAIPDTENQSDDRLKGIARARGFRSLLHVPLKSNGTPIGTVAISRKDPGSFSATSHPVAADFRRPGRHRHRERAAVQREREEALERQTATADVLKVISRSTFDLPPVLDTLISSACRLCEADLGAVRYQDGPTYRVAADYGSTPGWRDHLARQPAEPGRGSIFGRTVVDRRTIHIPDVLADPEYTRLATQKVMGYRAALGVPLIREGRVIGVLNLFRFAPGPFTEKQIELVETFADQAVIAIENVRLFNETKEALERQTATADILKVIASSPTDVQPVFEAIVDSTKRLLGGFSTAVFRFIDGIAYLEAFTPTNPAADETHEASFPRPRRRFSIVCHSSRAGRSSQVPDTDTDCRTTFGISREGAAFVACFLYR